MINYKDFSPIVAYGDNQTYDTGFVLNSGHEPLIIKGTNWKHDISKEDFTQYDYVELNGVRFNRVKSRQGQTYPASLYIILYTTVCFGEYQWYRL